MDWGSRFGTFRQLLHTGVRSPLERALLFDLVDDAFHDDRARYQEEWADYATTLSTAAPVILPCDSIPSFHYWSERAPFALFDVRFDREVRGRAAIDALAASPHLDLVRSLSTGQCRLGPAGASALAQAEGLSNLEALDLSSGYIKDEGLSALLDAGLLDGLSLLNVSSCNLSMESAARIARDVDTSALTHLSLSSNPFGPEGVIALAASSPSLRELIVRETVDYDPCLFRVDEIERFVALENLSNLERLNLAWSHLPEGNDMACASALARSPNLPSMKWLELDGVYDHTLAVAHALLESDAFPSLSRISLQYLESSSQEECAAFLSLPRAQSLTHLYIEDGSSRFLNAVSSTEGSGELRSITLGYVAREGLDALASWPGLAGVRSLELSRAHHDFVDTDLSALLASPFAEGLRELTLPRGQNLIEVPEMLANSPALHGLESLTFQEAYLNDIGRLRTFCSSPHIESLESLSLTRCELGPDELDVLCSCESFVSLRHLAIRDGGLEPRHLEALQRMPWFDSLESLELFIPYSWRMSARAGTRDDLPDVQRAILDNAEAIVAGLARGPLPSNLTALHVNVLDHSEAPLAPRQLATLLSRPELSHGARHGLAHQLKKQRLNGVARVVGLKGANRLERYTLIETLRRFVVALDASGT